MIIKGVCTGCKEEVSREYSYSILKGIANLSDSYMVNMREGCECEKKGGGNVRRDSLDITQILRDNKLKELFSRAR